MVYLIQRTVDPLRTQCTDGRVEQIYNAFELIRLLDREMPGQVVSCFLYVASHDGCHKQAMEQELGLTTSSSSRNTDILANGRPGRAAEGLHLLTKEDDPTDRRKSVLTLTPRGKALAQQMKSIIYG